jgi:hypothetical protein
MRRIPAIAFAAAILAATPLATVAQGWGPGSPGRGLGPCGQGQNSSQCWRVKNPEKHAACWSKANDSGLRGPARRSFMTECMAK